MVFDRLLLRRTSGLAHAALWQWPLAIMLLGMALLPAPARADDDLPGRVGRISEFGGQVYLAPEDRANEWAEIGLNYPITTGDNLWVSGEGRAEVDFGGGQLRLAADTNVHVSRLDDHEFSLFIAQGRAIVRLRTLDPGDTARIDTPNSQVTLLRPGLYRIDVSADRQQTTLVVREGEANAAVTNGLQQVLAGQTATLFGDQDVQADVRNGTGQDGFDTWSLARDRYYGRSRTASYVSQQMVGYADLDANGSWQSYPDYGAVWFPTTVANDWAPYRYGRWVTLPAWGPTWVDDAPWGYAPFHYGRWAYISGRWGWCPGRYVARPVWAPALVAWYGGSGWNVSGGRGPTYGWVPLGWRDPYLPSWRNCSNRCWTNYNRPYAVNVAERPRQAPTNYANNRVPGAITAMSGAAFAAGKPVAPNVVNVPGHLVETAPVLAGAPMLKPLPIASNVVRPGNGVPVPASAAFGTTKPMMVSPARTPAAAPGAAANATAPWAKPAPAPAYNAAEAPQRPGYAPPQTGRPAYNAAESPQQRALPPQNSAPGAAYNGRPQATYSAPPAPTAAVPAPTAAVPAPVPPRGAPVAAPPNPGNVNSAPPARFRGPQENAPVVNRAEMARPSPQPVPMMPRPVPQMQQAAPVLPPGHAVPPPVQNAAPPAANPAPKIAEKPVAPKPVPVN